MRIEYRKDGPIASIYPSRVDAVRAGRSAPGAHRIIFAGISAASAYPGYRPHLGITGTAHGDGLQASSAAAIRSAITDLAPEPPRALPASSQGGVRR